MRMRNGGWLGRGEGEEQSFHLLPKIWEISQIGGISGNSTKFDLYLYVYT